MKNVRSPWTDGDKHRWFQQQTIKRSYQDEVVAKIEELRARFDVTSYGSLNQDPSRYPLYLVKSHGTAKDKQIVLITGGVHGYETSGVQGALEFMRSAAPSYESDFYFVCAPCVSPWGFETINRWNINAVDPNRSFRTGTSVAECALLMQAVAAFSIDVHFDLHETTDTDNSVFRPALAARDGVDEDFSEIPDGFYTVGDTENPCPEFQHAIIQSVAKVTHIAPADENGNIIGSPLQQPGVINYPLKKLSLCAGLTNAKFVTTTEVYPDSPKATPAICIEAQIAAVRGGLDFILKR